MTINLSRRDAITYSLGFGVSCLLPGLDLRAAERRGPERPRSLLTIWLSGGPSQLETWDPHPGDKIGGMVQAIPTTIPGVNIAHLYPQTAEQIDCLSIIRSLVSEEGDHERGSYYLKTGYRPDTQLTHPALGAIAARELPRESLEIPTFISLGDGPFPARGGYLGDRYDPFRVFSPREGLYNMQAPVADDRQSRRLQNLEVVSRAFRTGRKPLVEKTLHQHTVEQALKMMTSEQLSAFKYEEEPEAVRKKYGETDFGTGCLLARRLIELGVQAVEVVLPGWDTHASNHEGHVTQANKLDAPLAALLHDLKERDLLASTVVMVLGEFGRTPRINALDGRDHWPTGFSCLLGGGGIRSGQVIGETDPTGEQKDPTDPIKIKDLYATVLTALSIDPAYEVITPIGRPMLFSDGTALERLLV
ncbi:MAG: DUF1501 domain-containing protein [Planctomycetota bacterium]|nr:DUF1501 domain-containing protein [Planctomycetota bacterium]MDA1214967.1 DUF1501 domain-containing protein [Planctomycetota bacterium]